MKTLLKLELKAVKIKTLDHFEIAATIFEPEISNQKLLLINSATGVRQQTYYDFAKYFAEIGFTAITYDYRGISLSKPEKMKGFKASMRISVSYTHLDVYKRQKQDMEKVFMPVISVLVMKINQ